METKKAYYVGSAKQIPNDGMKIQLNLTQLWGFLEEDKEIKEKIKSFKTKDGVENKTIDIVVFPMKEPQKYSTHSVKIDTYIPPDKGQQNTPAPAKTNKPPF